MKKVFTIWNNQGCYYASFEATSKAAAWKQANKQGYYASNGFIMQEYVY